MARDVLKVPPDVVPQQLLAYIETEGRGTDVCGICVFAKNHETDEAVLGVCGTSVSAENQETDEVVYRTPNLMRLSIYVNAGAFEAPTLTCAVMLAEHHPLIACSLHT